MIWPLLWSVVAAVLLISAEVGWRLGRQGRAAAESDEQPVAFTLQAAVLGLLGLLLGFTFSLAAARYEARKLLVLDEANAIGTTFLRTDLLDEPRRGELRSLLRSYVDARLAFYSAGLDLESARAAAARSNELVKRMWADVTAAARDHDKPPLAALLVASTNEIVDLSEKRRAALDNHVPSTIFVLLLALSIVAVGITGYVTGWGRRRFVLGTIVVPLLIAAVNLVTLDLDRPRMGLIRAGQKSLEQLRSEL